MTQNGEKKIKFFSGLSTKIDHEIGSYLPTGYDLEIIKPDISEAEQVNLVREADFIISYRFNPDDLVIKAAEKCKLFQLLAAGYDSVNLILLKEMGIPCSNNGGANSWAVADHTVLLMLALYRRLLDSDTQTRTGNWQRNIDGTNTFEMAGKKVGILGMGNIGKKVAKRVQGFDASVQYYDMYPLEEDANSELSLDYVGLEELFTTSDILSCHSPLTKETFHVVNESRFKLMKSTSVIINTSRGPIVNEIDLIKALENKIIAGAGLDVFENEPIDPSNKLLKMLNVVSTPHVAGTTWDTWSRRAKFAFENIIRVEQGYGPDSVARNFSD